MENVQKSYYAIIPASVRYDAELTASAKLLYGEITALCNERGYCWASNKYFAELYGVSKTSISTWINQLVKKGYIFSEVQYKKGTKEIDSRHLTIAPPIKENFNTPSKKVNEGMQENFNTPIQENFKDNNTSFNNTNNTTTTTDQSQEIFKSVQENIRFNLSPIEVQTIDYWLKDYPHDLILEAIKRAALSNVSNIRYVESILKDWQKKRITTIDEVKRDDEAFNNSKGGAKRGDNRPGAKQGNRNSGSFEDTFGYDVGF